MALVSYSIPSLWNGISQQPASLRNITQAEEQVNCLGTIADGLEKRPPTQHVDQLYGSVITSPFIHDINRDASERFKIVIENGDLKVFDLSDGSEVTVNFPDGKTYLTAANPRSSFAAVSIADSTFIINKTVTVATDGSTGAGSISSTVQEFAELPPTPSGGDIVAIEGQATNQFDNYYVIYDGTNGVWLETFKPGLANTLDPSTMPMELAYNGSTFTLQEITWDARAVGDEDSAPLPSFVGKTLNDIFFYRNRLGLLASENIVLSRSGDFFNFFPVTATDVSDEDPIDVTANHTKVSILKHGIAFNEALLLFSDQTQFLLGANTVLTPATVRLDVTTEFESSPNAKPVAAGQNVYFPVPRVSSTQFREYFVEPDTTVNDAANITAHAPTYVAPDIFKLAASTNEDILLAISSSVKNKIFVYKYYWNGDEKVQSSWSTWVYDEDDEVLDVSIIEDVIYVVVQRSGDGVYLEKMQLTGDSAEDELGVVVNLDRRVQLTGSYSSVTGLTTWTLPYTDDSEDIQVVLNSTFTGRAGEILETSRPTSTTITAEGDFSSDFCYVGKKYSMEYTFSEQFVRESRNNSLVAIVSGMFQLRNFRLRFLNSGYFRLEVTPEARQTYEYPMTGKILGSSTTILGNISLQTGTFRAPIATNSKGVVIKLVNDSYLPSQILSADVEGEFVVRSRRV